jgi:chemotaxis signal transduction protein
MSVATGSFVEVRVGPFRLALPTTVVLAVEPEVEVTPHLLSRGEEIPFADLAVVLGLGARPRVPRAAVIETVRGRLALGVDEVTHVRSAGTLRSAPIPRFALAAPQLFAAVYVDDAGLVLLLEPEALAQHVFERFDPAREARV